MRVADCAAFDILRTFKRVADLPLGPWDTIQEVCLLYRHPGFVTPGYDWAQDASFQDAVDDKVDLDRMATEFLELLLNPVA